MKKKISLMLAAALTAGLALTGCGGSKTSDITESSAAGAESESAAEVKGRRCGHHRLPGSGSERRYSDCGCAEDFQRLRGSIQHF